MQEKQSNQQILFLTDEQLRLGVEAMFFAYLGFNADPDKILEKHSYGRAHQRALYFINSYPETTVNHLIHILGVTKQSLNRVLRTLIDDGLVQVNIGEKDKRERNLILTDKGKALEEELSIVQRDRMRSAYKAAGPDAVAGFRTVLNFIIDKKLISKETDNEIGE